jgi:hypothetical protein
MGGLRGKLPTQFAPDVCGNILLLEFKKFTAMHKVAKYIRLHRKSVVDGSFGDKTEHDAPKKV